MIHIEIFLFDQNPEIYHENSVGILIGLSSCTLNFTCNEVAFNEKSAIKKENLRTKYFPFTYNDVILNEKPPIMKENLCIFFFFFIIGGVECTFSVLLYYFLCKTIELKCNNCIAVLPSNLTSRLCKWPTSKTNNEH